MALNEQIQADIKAALLGGNRFVAETLRGLRAAILNEEVATGKRDSGLDDGEIEKIISREVKKRHESALLYEQNGRAESAANEREEATILGKYLPEQLPEEEVNRIVGQTIEEMGAVGLQSLGLVIAAVKQRVGNTADGATVARIVKQKLTPEQ